MRSEDDLIYSIPRYLSEVKKKDGTEYLPQTKANSS